MRADEAKALGHVSGTAVRMLTRMVRGAHFAVSGTVHGTIERVAGPVAGPIARPVRGIQDAVTAGVYGAVGLGLDGAARVGGHLAARRARAGDVGRSSVHDGSGAVALAVGLGLYGDRWAVEHRALAPALHIRRRGMPVPASPEGLADAFLDATPALAVYLHGLFETEHAWRLGTAERPSYASRLKADVGLTPVMVRYNSGLRISANAAALAALLDDLVAGWPVPVERLVLIGHSMGGLVIHGALALAAEVAAGDDQTPASVRPPWLDLVTDTIALGSPHHGSPIARGVTAAARRLDRQERGRWLTEVLDLRSVGIRDLDHGNVMRADWEGHETQPSADRRTHPEPAVGIRHHAVVGLTAGGRLPAALAGRLGDLVVPHDSAAHVLDSAARRFTDARVAVVPGVSHLGLLNHDAAYEHLRRWLTADPQAPVPS